MTNKAKGTAENLSLKSDMYFHKNIAFGSPAKLNYTRAWLLAER